MRLRVLLLAALVCVACWSCSICEEEFPIPEGLEDSALFLDEVAQVLVPNPPERRTTHWGCAFAVRLPYDVHQDMLEYEALVSQIDWEHPETNTKISKHSLMLLIDELENMHRQLTSASCVESPSTAPVIAQLAQVAQERQRRLSFLIGELQDTGVFRPELLQLLRETHEYLVPSIRKNDFVLLGQQLGVALQKL